MHDFRNLRQERGKQLTVPAALSCSKEFDMIAIADWVSQSAGVVVVGMLVLCCCGGEQKGFCC
jgi:hypothetical protein